METGKQTASVTAWEHIPATELAQCLSSITYTQKIQKVEKVRIPK